MKSLTECSICRGNGWVVKDVPLGHPEFGKSVRCPECTDWLAHSRLTPEERQFRVDDILNRPDDSGHQLPALRFLAKQMLERPFGFLTIYGQKGSGKSMLLAAMVAEFCRGKTHAVYFNSGEIVAMLNAGDDKEIDGFRVVGNYEANKQSLKVLPVLAIDEMDKILWTPWQIAQIGEVVEYRYRHAARLVTLFAMNRPPQEWLNALGVEHIASRMADGRFNRPWPAEVKKLPACLNQRREVPGLMEVILPDMRPVLSSPIGFPSK